MVQPCHECLPFRQPNMLIKNRWIRVQFGQGRPTLIPAFLDNTFLGTGWSCQVLSNPDIRKIATKCPERPNVGVGSRGWAEEKIDRGNLTVVDVLLHLFVFSYMPWAGCELRSLSPAPLRSDFWARRPLKEMPASCSSCSWRSFLCTLDGWFSFSWLPPWYESSTALALAWAASVYVNFD